MIIEIVGKEQFDTTIAQYAESGELIMVDFWAEWCGPCKMLKPVLHDLAEKHEGLILLTVNVDEEANQELSMTHSVRSIPQVNFYKSGASIDQFVGALPPDQIEALIKKHMA